VREAHGGEDVGQGRSEALVDFLNCGHL
jgi:hypothetical protein